MSTTTTTLIRTDSGVAFELKATPKLDAPRRYTVIASVGRQAVTAESIVGMDFEVGGNPYWYARGYAQIIQRELNAMNGV